MYQRLLTLLLLIVLFIPGSVHSQQVVCELQADYKTLGATAYDLLVDFRNDLQSYVNNHTWGDPSISDKVSCTMTVFVKSVVGQNRYSAQVFIGSQRPIFNTEKSTALLRLFDEEWEFTYVRNQPINHNLHVFEDLASFLDFYVYTILGYDADTYAPAGGAEWFQKAADVANLGRSRGVKGWDLKNSAYSKTQLIDEIVSPKIVQVRRAVYQYHYWGIDSLAINPARASGHILRSLETIGRLRKEVDSRNLYIKSFFETKYQEIAEIFQTYKDPNVYLKLGTIDPAHQATYDEYRAKRK